MLDNVIEPQQHVFQLRGSLFTLTVLQLHSYDSAQFDKQLREIVQQAPKFFKYAPIVLDLQQLVDASIPIDFAAIKQQLSQYDIIPVGVRGGTPEHHEMAKQNGMAILSISKTEDLQVAARQKKSNENTTNPAPTYHNNNLLVTKPVRSGQQVYAKGGDLIVVGTVSHGAELLADGNIHVYGPLRGRALAGINENTDARIFCHSMEAELVSIAGRYIVNETLIKNIPGVPQQIYLEDGKLKIKAI